jgi:uncharacterized membrane protein YjgN (DUF898 family)
LQHESYGGATEGRYRPVTTLPPAFSPEPEAGPQKPAPQPSAASALTPTRPVYDGTLGELYGIYLRHLVLMLVTLGWSRFWGRTRLRRYLWNHLAILGDRFEYRGRGIELFIGFILVLLILLTLGGLVWLAWVFIPEGTLPTGMSLLDLAPLALALIGFPLAYVGHYAGLRYKLSRTRWRGLRCGMVGSAWAYGARATFLTFANAMTGQLLLPVVSINLAQPRITHARVGTQPLEFAGRSGDIYSRYIGYYFLNILVWLVAIGIAATAVGVTVSSVGKEFEDIGKLFTKPGPFTLLLLFAMAFAFYLVFSLVILPVRCWWQAYLLRYLVSRTRAGKVLFATAISTKQMWGFMVLNYLILLFTLGLGWPWVMHRTLRLISSELWLYGAPEGSSIRQRTDREPGYGEGLLDMFDVGAI